MRKWIILRNNCDAVLLNIDSGDTGFCLLECTAIPWFQRAGRGMSRSKKGSPHTPRRALLLGRTLWPKPAS